MKYISHHNGATKKLTAATTSQLDSVKQNWQLSPIFGWTPAIDPTQHSTHCFYMVLRNKQNQPASSITRAAELQASTYQ
jgi:hypothetical protein